MVFRCSCAYVANSEPKQGGQRVQNSAYHNIESFDFLTLGLFHSISLSILLKKSDLDLGGNSGSTKSSPFFRNSFLMELYFCPL